MMYVCCMWWVLYDVYLMRVWYDIMYSGASRVCFFLKSHHRIISYHVVSYHIVSYHHIISYCIGPYHIISYHINYMSTYILLFIDAQNLVSCFLEMHPNKIDTIYHDANSHKSVDIKSITHVKPPFLCCVSINRANGIEEKLSSFVAGVDYFQVT